MIQKRGVNSTSCMNFQWGHSSAPIHTGVWEAVASTLAGAMADNKYHSIDSTTIRGHVSAAGAKGGLANRLLAARGAGSHVKFIVSVTPKESRSPSTSRRAKRRTAPRSKTSTRSAT